MNLINTDILPNFFIAGAAKCGSYTLYHYLNKHPNIIMSSSKEPGIFSYSWNDGEGLNQYTNYFRDYNGQKAIGEATVEYMVHPESPKRISKIIPNAKFIFILRNPFERANSHYWHRIKSRAIDRNNSFGEIIREKENSFPIRYGLYADHIKRFLEYFSLEQIKILILEEFSDNPPEYFKQIFEFLEVNKSINVDYKKPLNTAKIQQFWLLDDILHSIRTEAGALKKVIPPFIRGFLLKQYEKLKNYNKRDFEYPPLDDKYIKELSGYFLPQISELEMLIDKDLSEWRTYNGNKIDKYLH